MSESDRELLELAAKAAGLLHAEYFDDAHGKHVIHFIQGKGRCIWSPLEDDGDALRLAVKLGIEIHPDREVKEVVTAFCVRNPSLIGLNTIEEFNGDEMAATRRAITRAAAEIGKAIP